jgi:AcrR family transcriptional regulator
MIEDERILEVALDVIAERGYTGATTRRIAEAAGINEVTLFRRFGNKKNLLMEAAAQEARNSAVAQIEYTGDLEVDLRRVIEFYTELMNKRARTVLMLLSELPRQPELLEAMGTPIGIIGTVTGILHRYQKEGLLQPEPPMSAFYALVGPIYLEAAVRLALDSGSVTNASAPVPPATDIDATEHVRQFLCGRKRT